MPAIQPGQPILCTASDSLLWQHGRFSPCLRTLPRPYQGGNGAQDWSEQDEIFAALLAASLNLFYSLEEAQIANSFSREAICWDFSSILIFVALIIWRKNYKKYSHHFGWKCRVTGWERLGGCTETANKDATWLRETSSCCCLTTAAETRQQLLNKISIPFLPSLYNYVNFW